MVVLRQHKKPQNLAVKVVRHDPIDVPSRSSFDVSCALVGLVGLVGRLGPVELMAQVELDAVEDTIVEALAVEHIAVGILLK
jgi:hypothetical protein